MSEITPTAAIAQSIISDADKAATAIVFPPSGLIDPVAQVETMRRLALAMPETERAGYPEKVRQAILAHAADPDKNPAVSDHDLCMAVFIQRMSDSPLTNDQLEVKATGRAKKSDKPDLGSLMALANSINPTGT